jgi:hypothetical protein
MMMRIRFQQAQFQAWKRLVLAARPFVSQSSRQLWEPETSHRLDDKRFILWMNTLFKSLLSFVKCFPKSFHGRIIPR